MTQVTIESFAKQIKVSVEKLLDQLSQAGISGKTHADMLSDKEKLMLLEFLKGGGKAASSGEQISVRRKTKDEIMQTSRTGAARTVHVEVKKSRTFVKRSVIEAQQKAAKEAQQEAERKRLEAEKVALEQAEAERRRLEEEEQSRLDAERHKESAESEGTSLPAGEIADQASQEPPSGASQIQPSPPYSKIPASNAAREGKNRRKTGGRTARRKSAPRRNCMQQRERRAGCGGRSASPERSRLP